MGIGSQMALQAWQSLPHPGGSLGECGGGAVQVLFARVCPTLNRDGQAVIPDLSDTRHRQPWMNGALQPEQTLKELTGRGSPLA